MAASGTDREGITAYAITDISSIEPDAAGKLRSAGIRTTARLLDLAKTPKNRKDLAERTGIEGKRILSLANMADRMRIKGVGEDYASLLQAAGVDTIRELKYRNPAKLARAMAEINAKRKLVRVLPSPRAVERWIEQAKRLQLKITYR
jgi:predicted flap endonuclease-1-like 5' DNA nuclease